MTKKCLHKDEKSAPFLRQKPAKNALFSSISQEKVEQNKSAKCYRIGAFANKVSQRLQPKSVISVMMITTLVFEQMSLRFEGAMGFHCNRKTEMQMTKRTISLSQMSRAKLA